jgi:hypothetical protein
MKEQLNWIVGEIETVTVMAKLIDEDQRASFLEDSIKAIKRRLEAVNKAY